jgi:hypothetical protein
MKKVALISSFCDTEQKINVLNKNIDIIINLGIDVIVISPFALPNFIVNKCNYFFKTNDNPVLDWPQRSMYTWKEIYIDNKKFQMTRTYPDYGWAGLFQVKQLSEIALLLNYEQFFHMIYDLKIDDNVLNGLNSEKTCNIYPSKRDEEIWKVGLHFMIFDQKNLSRFVSNIYLDSYLTMSGGHAFRWLENLHVVFPYNFEETPVGDEIYYYEGEDFYNYSPINEFSMFIIKDDKILDNIKLLFYSVKETTPIKIIINEDIIDNFTYENNLIDLGFNKTNPKQVKIIYKDNEYDITDTINKIKHNTFRKV